MTEFPTIWVQGHHPFTEKQITEIDRKIGKLSEEDKNAFFDMSNAFPELRCKEHSLTEFMYFA